MGVARPKSVSVVELRLTIADVDVRRRADYVVAPGCDDWHTFCASSSAQPELLWTTCGVVDLYCWGLAMVRWQVGDDDLTLDCVVGDLAMVCWQVGDNDFDFELLMTCLINNYWNF